MRLGMIVPVLARAGDDLPALRERHRLNIALAEALAAAGVEARLYADGLRRQELGLEGGASWHLIPRPEGLAARVLPVGAHLIAAALGDGVDALHLFHLLDGRTTLLGALAPVPAWAEYNGGAVPESTLRRRALTLATSRLRGLLFTARAAAEPFLRAGALSRRVPIYAVPENSSLLPEPRAVGAAPPGPPRLLAVGRIAPEKDPWTIVEAFRRVLRARPEARMVWATALDDEARALRAELERDPQLAGKVELGPRPAQEMSELYSTAGVMLHPSLRETCGTAVIEALQAGCPVVVSDIPSLAALIRGSGMGQAAPGDAAALAGEALRLLADPQARERARARYLAALSYAALGLRRAAIYRGEAAADY